MGDERKTAGKFISVGDCFNSGGSQLLLEKRFQPWVQNLSSYEGYPDSLPALVMDTTLMFKLQVIKPVSNVLLLKQAADYEIRYKKI